MLLKTEMKKLPNNRSLRYSKVGAGPPIFLLHGYPDNLQVWFKMAPLLAKKYSVYSIDWPGMGESEVWPGGATPFHMADRLKVIIEAFGFKKVTLFAQDMGAQAATSFSHKYPDKVDELIVANFLAFHNLSTSWEIDLLRNFGWNRVIINRLPKLVFSRALKTFLPAVSDINRDVKDDLWTCFSKPDVRRFINKMCSGYQATLHRLPKMYQELRVPVKIIWGEKDKHFPLIQAKALHNNIPGSRLIEISDGFHWMCIHKAEELSKIINGNKSNLQ